MDEPGPISITVEQSAGSLGKFSPFGFVPVASNAVLRFTTGGDDWTVFFDALKENGLAKILAEPARLHRRAGEAAAGNGATQ